MTPKVRPYASRKKWSNFSCLRSFVSACLRISCFVGYDTNLILFLVDPLLRTGMVSSELIVTKLLSFISEEEIFPWSSFSDSFMFVLMKTVSNHLRKFSRLNSEPNSKTRSKFSGISIDATTLWVINAKINSNYYIKQL